LFCHQNKSLENCPQQQGQKRLFFLFFPNTFKYLDLLYCKFK
jgi:hypothetical protein